MKLTRQHITQIQAALNECKPSKTIQLLLESFRRLKIEGENVATNEININPIKLLHHTLFKLCDCPQPHENHIDHYSIAYIQHKLQSENINIPKLFIATQNCLFDIYSAVIQQRNSHAQNIITDQSLPPISMPLFTFIAANTLAPSDPHTSITEVTTFLAQFSSQTTALNEVMRACIKRVTEDIQHYKKQSPTLAAYFEQLRVRSFHPSKAIDSMNAATKEILINPAQKTAFYDPARQVFDDYLTAVYEKEHRLCIPFDWDTHSSGHVVMLGLAYKAKEEILEMRIYQLGLGTKNTHATIHVNDQKLQLQEYAICIDEPQHKITAEILLQLYQIAYLSDRLSLDIGAWLYDHFLPAFGRPYTERYQFHDFQMTQINNSCPYTSTMCAIYGEYNHVTRGRSAHPEKELILCDVQIREYAVRCFLSQLSNRGCALFSDIRLAQQAALELSIIREQAEYLGCQPIRHFADQAIHAIASHPVLLLATQPRWDTAKITKQRFTPNFPGTIASDLDKCGDQEFYIYQLAIQIPKQLPHWQFNTPNNIIDFAIYTQGASRYFQSLPLGIDDNTRFVATQFIFMFLNSIAPFIQSYLKTAQETQPQYQTSILINCFRTITISLCSWRNTLNARFGNKVDISLDDLSFHLTLPFNLIIEHIFREHIKLAEKDIDFSKFSLLSETLLRRFNQYNIHLFPDAPIMPQLSQFYSMCRDLADDAQKKELSPTLIFSKHDISYRIDSYTAPMLMIVQTLIGKSLSASQLARYLQKPHDDAPDIYNLFYEVIYNIIVCTIRAGTPSTNCIIVDDKVYLSQGAPMPYLAEVMNRHAPQAMFVPFSLTNSDGAYLSANMLAIHEPTSEAIKIKLLHDPGMAFIHLVEAYQQQPGAVISMLKSEAPTFSCILKLLQLTLSQSPEKINLLYQVPHYHHSTRKMLDDMAETDELMVLSAIWALSLQQYENMSLESIKPMFNDFFTQHINQIFSPCLSEAPPTLTYYLLAQILTTCTPASPSYTLLMLWAYTKSEATLQLYPAHNFQLKSLILHNTSNYPEGGAVQDASMTEMLNHLAHAYDFSGSHQWHYTPMPAQFYTINKPHIMLDMTSGQLSNIGDKHCLLAHFININKLKHDPDLCGFGIVESELAFRGEKISGRCGRLMLAKRIPYICLMTESSEDENTGHCYITQIPLCFAKYSNDIYMLLSHFSEYAGEKKPLIEAQYRLNPNNNKLTITRVVNQETQTLLKSKNNKLPDGLSHLFPLAWGTENGNQIKSISIPMENIDLHIDQSGDVWCHELSDQPYQLMAHNHHIAQKIAGYYPHRMLFANANRTHYRLLITPLVTFTCPLYKDGRRILKSDPLMPPAVIAMLTQPHLLQPFHSAIHLDINAIGDYQPCERLVELLYIHFMMGEVDRFKQTLSYFYNGSLDTHPKLGSCLTLEQKVIFNQIFSTQYDDFKLPRWEMRTLIESIMPPDRLSPINNYYITDPMNAEQHVLHRFNRWRIPPRSTADKDDPMPENATYQRPLNYYAHLHTKSTGALQKVNLHKQSTKKPAPMTSAFHEYFFIWANDKKAAPKSQVIFFHSIVYAFFHDRKQFYQAYLLLLTHYDIVSKNHRHHRKEIDEALCLGLNLCRILLGLRAIPQDYTDHIRALCLKFNHSAEQEEIHIQHFQDLYGQLISLQVDKDSHKTRLYQMVISIPSGLHYVYPDIDIPLKKSTILCPTEAPSTPEEISAILEKYQSLSATQITLSQQIRQYLSTGGKQNTVLYQAYQFLLDFHQIAIMAAAVAIQNSKAKDNPKLNQADKAYIATPALQNHDLLHFLSRQNYYSPTADLASFIKTVRQEKLASRLFQAPPGIGKTSFFLYAAYCHESVAIILPDANFIPAHDKLQKQAAATGLSLQSLTDQNGTYIGETIDIPLLEAFFNAWRASGGVLTMNQSTFMHLFLSIVDDFHMRKPYQCLIHHNILTSILDADLVIVDELRAMLNPRFEVVHALDEDGNLTQKQTQDIIRVVRFALSTPQILNEAKQIQAQKTQSFSWPMRLQLCKIVLPANLASLAAQWGSEIEDPEAHQAALALTDRFHQDDMRLIQVLTHLVLPAALSQRCGVDYGPRQQGDDIAIPYRGVSRPETHNEFSYLIMRFVLSMLMLNQHFLPAHCEKLCRELHTQQDNAGRTGDHKYREHLSQCLSKWTQNRFSLKSIKPKSYPDLAKALYGNLDMIDFYAQHILARDCITAVQMSHTNPFLMLSLFKAYRTNVLTTDATPPDVGLIYQDTFTEIESVGENNEKLFSIIMDPTWADIALLPTHWDNTSTLLHHLTYNTRPGETVHMIIDVGQLFVGVDHREVATCWLCMLPQHIEYVLIYDQENHQVLMNRSGKSKPFISSNSAASNLAIFIDDMNAQQGSDVPICSNYVAMTIKPSLSTLQYVQSAYRARGLGKNQRIIYAVKPEDISRFTGNKPTPITLIHLRGKALLSERRISYRAIQESVSQHIHAWASKHSLLHFESNLITNQIQPSCFQESHRKNTVLPYPVYQVAHPTSKHIRLIQHEVQKKLGSHLPPFPHINTLMEVLGDSANWTSSPNIHMKHKQRQKTKTRQSMLLALRHQLRYREEHNGKTVTLTDSILMSQNFYRLYQDDSRNLPRRMTYMIFTPDEAIQIRLLSLSDVSLTIQKNPYARERKLPQFGEKCFLTRSELLLYIYQRRDIGLNTLLLTLLCFETFCIEEALSQSALLGINDFTSDHQKKCYMMLSAMTHKYPALLTSEALERQPKIKTFNALHRQYGGSVLRRESDQKQFTRPAKRMRLAAAFIKVHDTDTTDSLSDEEMSMDS